MQIPGHETPTERLSPLQLLASITGLAGRHFPRVPDLLTTDRFGRFEGGWYRHEERIWVPMAMAATSLKQRQYLRLRLEMLMRQYDEHPGADRTLMARSGEFPRSLELLLPLPSADPA